MISPRLLCVGALISDMIFRVEALPTTSGKFLPIEMVQTAAGMASSAATAARRQGGYFSLWASVGDDAVGRDLVKQMQEEGIDCTLVRRVAGSHLLKFYPSEPAGSADVLAEFGSVFPDVSFMPSGKINLGALPKYAALSNVASVGGTCMHSERGTSLSRAEIRRRMTESLEVMARPA
jgi:hypothetical protein